MAPLRFDGRAALVALWEVVGAFGVFLTVYGVVWSVAMLAVGGPTVLDPRSILLFAREWANDAIPPDVQKTALAALSILFLAGPCVAIFRREWLLPKGLRMSDREKVAIFKSLPLETRRKIAMKEVGNPLDHMSPEERILLAAQLEPELLRRRAGEERLVSSVARRIRLGTERVERREAERVRRIRLDGGGSGRALGGVVLRPEELNLLDGIRSRIRDGLAFADLVPDMSERLRQAVLAEGKAEDEALIEVLERLAESRRAAHEAAGVSRPSVAPDPENPAGAGTPASVDAIVPAAIPDAGAADAPTRGLFPRSVPAEAGSKPSGSSPARQSLDAAGEPSGGGRVDSADDAFASAFDAGESESAEGTFIVKRDVPEPMVPSRAPEVPAPAAVVEAASAAGGAPREVHCRDVPELGAFLDAWADFQRWRAVGSLEQDSPIDTYRALAAARRNIGAEAMSRARGARDWRGFDIKLAAADEMMENVRSLFDLLSTSSADSESAWHAIFAYGSWWRTDLVAWGASEGRRSEVLQRIAAVEAAMEAAA